MQKICDLKTLAVLTALVASILNAGNALAADTDVLTNVLKKVDNLVCTFPEKIKEFYSPKLVIMFDDRRTLLENRIESYKNMKAEYREMKCDFKRTLLTGQVGQQLGYVLVDELVSVKSRMSTDERQHNVCTYVFGKEGSNWKITHEHCSSLPDYTIAPGEDGLYYYHNPVY